MKITQPRFVISCILCTGLLLGGVTLAAQNIIRDKKGNSYQVDSNNESWVAVDGKNFNAEIKEVNNYTIKDIEDLELVWQQKKEQEKIAKNIHLYEAIFRVKDQYKKQLVSNTTVAREEWNPMYIKTNHRMVTKTNDKRIALEKIIQDQEGNIYQIDSRGRIWVSLDGANWNSRVMQ